MERPIFKPIGTPVEQLDTPSFLVDLTVLEENIETLHGFFRHRAAKVRPHIEAHRCPAIAHKQLAAGGTVGGICATTVGQAEVFAQAGFNDILIANEIVTRQKIDRLCALARHARMTVAVDNPANIGDLSAAASASAVTLGVVVDIDTGLNRCGVEPGRPAVDLARAITDASNLEFLGLMTCEGTLLEANPETRATQSRDVVQKVLDTREMVEKAGMDVQVVSVGGTHNYEIVGDIDGVTEVPAGSYALMDGRSLEHRPQFQPAARVMASVISRPEPGLAITDGGAKAVGIDGGLPVLDGVSGTNPASPPTVVETLLSAEHGAIRLEADSDAKVDLGDKAWLIPSDVGMCANLHDYVHTIRDGRLEAVWNIAARGAYR